jgi:putative hydrolase of the HAD superfamily
VIEAVFWDFGGVILTSPFDAFARYERRRGLPGGVIRSINATNPHTNAWARLERTEISTADFDEEFAREAAAIGLDIRGADVLELLAGDVRKEMVQALDGVIAAGYRTACLTNNVVADGDVDVRPEVAAVMARFDHVVESSKVGVRKPEPAFYELACRLTGVEPAAVVFLDDLGVNLKPAAAMGMTTIKVTDPAAAIAELESVLGIALATPA